MANLKDFVNDLPNDQKIRIGANEGSRFIYIGTVRDFSIAGTEESIRQYYLNKINFYYTKISPKTAPDARKNYARMAQNMGRRLLALTSLAEREVVDVYPGASEPDTLVIIITGKEEGFDYQPPKKPLNVGNIADSAAGDHLTAIYKIPAKNLTNSYIALLKASYMGNQAAVDRAEDAIYYGENEILSMPYSSHEINETILRECRLHAEDSFNEWKRRRERNAVLRDM